jgi:outer membrane protein assembly factor BamB
MDGYIYVLDSGSGERVAALNLDSPVSSSPVLMNGKLIVATQNGDIYSINTENQSFILLKSLEADVVSALTGSDGVIYIHTNGDEILYAINAESGASVWQYEV